MAEALGVQVVQHDDGSRDGMHDLDIVRAGRRDAAEVTAAADAKSIELWKLVTDREDRWIVPALEGGWSVALEPSAQARRVLVKLPDLLAEMERRGVREYRRRFTQRPLVDPIERHAVNLGVMHASQGDTSYPGVIYLTVQQARERMGGIVDPTCGNLPPWVAGFLADPKQADVRAKLNSSGAVERHTFIILPVFTTAPFSVVDPLWRGDTPTDAPELPAEITHVWLASLWDIATGLRWSSETGWTTFRSSLAAVAEVPPEST